MNKDSDQNLKQSNYYNCIRLAIGNSMTLKSPYKQKPGTPDLKRTYMQHYSTNSCPRTYTAQFVPFSDHKQNIRISTVNPFDTVDLKSNNSKVSQKQSDLSTSKLVFQSEEAKAGVGFIHGQIGKFIKEDLYRSIKSKDQFHKYEQRQPLGDVWVGEAKLIPKIVYCAIKKQKQNTNERQGRINYSQGLLPRSGFMYFAVQNKIFFFDSETMDENSDEALALELQSRPLSALFQIQQLELGPPYLHHKQQVLVFLHPYEAELYHFEVQLPFRTNSARKLIIQGLNIRLSLPHQRPCPLVKAPNGKLYCTNQQGSLCCIQFDHALFSGKKQLSIRKLSSSLKSFWEGTTKMLTTNLKYFGKTIKNYTSSFFPTQLHARIVYDSNRQLFIVFIRKLCKQGCQQLHIYQQSKQKKLYSLVDQQFLGKDNSKEKVLQIIALQDKLNNDCNIAIYMSNGRRIFLDLNQDKMRKCIVYEPPLGHRRFGERITLNISAEQVILQQNYAMHLFYYNKKWNCVLTDQKNGKYQRMCAVRIKTSNYNKMDDESYRLYHQQPREIGPFKKLLAGSRRTFIKSLSQTVRQIYYQPQEILYSTDLVTQRIKILRPIDVFFSLFYAFNMSCSRLIQNIKTALKSFQIEDYICFCTQICTDTEGIYLINHDLAIQSAGLSAKQSLNIFKNHGIQTIRYSEIPKETHKKLMQLMIDLASKQGTKTKQEKEQIMVLGIAKYTAGLIRIVWESSINDISKETCIAVINSLSQSKELLKRLKFLIRNDIKSFIWQMQCWIERVKQFLWLVSFQSSLPEMKASEALLVEPEFFHKNLFVYLTKHYEPISISQFEHSIPIYCSPAFVHVYRLWTQVNCLKQIKQILQICSKHNSLPQYFIQYLQKVKGITELSSKCNSSQSQRINQNNLSYRDLIKMIEGSFYRLEDKQRLLSQAEQQFKKEEGDLKESRETLRDGSTQLKRLHAQIKTQILIKQEYLRQSKVSSLKEDNFNFFFTRNKQNLNQTISVVECIQRVLFDEQILSECIEQLDSNQLKLVHTFYFNNQRFASYLADVVDEIYTLFCENPAKLVDIYKDQINFMIVVAKLPIETNLLLTIYTERMLNSPNIMTVIKQHHERIDNWAFWTLCFCAEIGLSPLKIYGWAIEKIELETDQQRYEYIMICCLSLVTHYLPQKKQELRIMYNSRIMNDNPFGKINILLSKLQEQQ